jgi:hypothetical protein
VCDTYVVQVGPDGNQVIRLDHLTAPKLAEVVWTNWPHQKAARLRTRINQYLEQRTGKRSPVAGSSQDVVRLYAEAAD